MRFPGDMKLKPETADEITECADANGIRRRLRHYAYSGSEPMVKAVLDMALYRGLSGEDTMTWLAFEALQRLEHCKGLILDRVATDPLSPFMKNAPPPPSGPLDNV